MGIFVKKPKKYKNPQNLNEASQIEDFVHEKPYYAPPEYPGYDAKILPQHGVSDPLNLY